MHPRERLIVGLDLPDVAAAERLAARLDGHVGVFKIGYHLVFSGGLGLARELAEQGRKVFLDLKLLDIDSTVARGVESACRLGAAFVTIHGYPNAMRAAVAARGDSACQLIAITVLTSLDQDDLAAAGYDRSIDDLVALRSRAAEAAGVDCVVASGREARLIREVAPGLKIVTPGIRPTGSDQGNQKRALTPAAAIEAGADYLVVGRPIVEAPDPVAAADAIVAEIQGRA